MRILRWAVPIVVAAVTLSSCGSVQPGSRPLQPTFAAPPGQIVFQISSGAGFAAPSVYLAARPQLTITGNGDAYVLAPGAEDGMYAGRPVALAKGTVPPTTLRQLVRQAAGSGLFGDADYGTVQITDAGDTTFVFHPGRAPARTVSVYALDIADVDGTLTVHQRRNRQALRTFAQRLESSVVDPTAWLPNRIDVTAVPDFGAEAGTPAARWPGPPLGRLLEAHGRGRCGVLSGHAARAVYLAARRHPGTYWVAGGRAHALVIRALLPNETGCRN